MLHILQRLRVGMQSIDKNNIQTARRQQSPIARKKFIAGRFNILIKEIRQVFHCIFALLFGRNRQVRINRDFLRRF